jgi:hypothetical protein
MNLFNISQFKFFLYSEIEMNVSVYHIMYLAKLKNISHT